MWDTPFDESMLDQRHVIIRCMTADDATHLFHILSSHGIGWNYSPHAVDPSDTRFSERSGKGTCYHVTNTGLMFGSCLTAETERIWKNYIKCTFGAPCILSDLNIPEDTEISLIGW